MSIPTIPNPNPQPMIHNGRPAGGRHVPSRVPGAGPYDCSQAVGSNVTPAPGPDADSDEVLAAPPWVAVNPNASQWMPPLN
jgi:hypothetical protein